MTFLSEIRLTLHSSSGYISLNTNKLFPIGTKSNLSQLFLKKSSFFHWVWFNILVVRFRSINVYKLECYLFIEFFLIFPALLCCFSSLSISLSLSLALGFWLLSVERQQKMYVWIGKCYYEVYIVKYLQLKLENIHIKPNNPFISD